MNLRIAVVGTLLVVAAALVRAQGTPSIQGVWRVSEVVVTGAGATANKSPQPGIYIFTKQHYSIMTVSGTAPRNELAAAANPQQLTDAEKLARYAVWDAFVANSGTYQINGNSIRSTALVAKNPSMMQATNTREFKIEGNTLTLILRSRRGEPVSETTTRLTRIE